MRFTSKTLRWPLFMLARWEGSILPNSIVFSLIETYQRSDVAGTAPISPPLWRTHGTVASCKAYLFKSIPIKQPFGLNTLDKDQGGWGSSPVELFTRGQRTSALFSLEPPPPPQTLRRVRVCSLLWILFEKLSCHLDCKFFVSVGTQKYTKQSKFHSDFKWFLALALMWLMIQNVIVLLFVFKKLHCLPVCACVF